MRKIAITLKIVQIEACGINRVHSVPDFEFGRKKLSPQVTTVSDKVFLEEFIGEGFKIATVAVFEKILLFGKKIWFIFDRNF